MDAFKRAIADAYTLSATSFAELADRLVFRHLAEPLVALGRGCNGRVLDVAGGTGAVARNFESAVCTDISFGQLSNNRVALKVQADAESLPFRDASFAATLCAFGINHFPDPARAVAEMARVGETVGVLTWQRPEPDPYAPREIVVRELERVAGRGRTETGAAINEMTNDVGNVATMEAIFAAAGIHAEVSVTQVDVPWGRTDEWVEYRLSMLGAEQMTDDVESVRRAATRAIDALPASELMWRPSLIIALSA